MPFARMTPGRTAAGAQEPPKAGRSGGRLALLVAAAVGAAGLTVLAPAGAELTGVDRSGAGAAASGATAVGIAANAGAGGHWLAYTNGDVSTTGSAAQHGNAANLRLNTPIVGLAATADAGGYWLLGGDGGIFSFGNATFRGSTGDLRLNQPVVSLASDPQGRGYWFVASDGGIFSFGTPFYGSTGDIRLNQPVVGMAPTQSGNGYWLVARDGGIFTFGDATFSGSTGDIVLNQPIVGMAADPDGVGYWMVAADGGIFAFDADFQGSGVGTVAAGDRVTGMTARPGGGYSMVTARGSVLHFAPAAPTAPPAPAVPGPVNSPPAPEPVRPLRRVSVTLNGDVRITGPRSSVLPVIVECPADLTVVLQARVTQPQPVGETRGVIENIGGGSRNPIAQVPCTGRPEAMEFLLSTPNETATIGLYPGEGTATVNGAGSFTTTNPGGPVEPVDEISMPGPTTVRVVE